MKKTLITLAAFAMASVASAAVQEQTITWDFSSMPEGFVGNNITVGNVTDASEETKSALTSGYGYEVGTSTLHDMFKAAQKGEGTFTLTASILYDGSGNVALFHIGSKNTGFTLCVYGGKLAAGQGDPASSMFTSTTTLASNTWTDVCFTLKGSNATLTVGEVSTSTDAFSVSWDETNSSENEKYSIATCAPGYDWYLLEGSAIANKSLTASYSIPEPATATLSLLALAGLAARRRRK